MQEENLKVDKDYVEAFNQGYEVSKELGLKSDILNGLSSGNNRMQAMQDGMKQYEKEKSLQKEKSSNKDTIPKLDLDKMDNRDFHVGHDTKEPDKSPDKDL